MVVLRPGKYTNCLLRQETYLETGRHTNEGLSATGRGLCYDRKTCKQRPGAASNIVGRETGYPLPLSAGSLAIL